LIENLKVQQHLKQYSPRPREATRAGGVTNVVYADVYAQGPAPRQYNSRS
jgi:hypothetical protein